MAAARKVSHAASVTVFPSSFNFQASFAAVVVFPDPLTPIIAITMGFPSLRPRPDAEPASGPGVVERVDEESGDLEIGELEPAASALRDSALSPVGLTS